MIRSLGSGDASIDDQEEQTDCPPGLESLLTTNQLIIHEEVDSLEVIGGGKTRNQYTIRDHSGQKIFSAVEDADFWRRNRYRKDRPFTINIFDHFGREVMRLRRPYRCNSCLFPCWLQRIEVFAPPGVVAGTVEQEWRIFNYSFAVEDSLEEKVLTIKGPTDASGAEFEILSSDGSNKVGRIRKQWSRLCNEVITPADNFEISFPVDLDVRVKAALIGACVLIDMMLFQQSGRGTNYL